MPETVIVTVRWNGKECDFEFPTEVPVKSFIDSFLAAARNSFQGILVQGKELVFLYENKEILPEYTFGKCGIYDGSILELVIR